MLEKQSRDVYNLVAVKDNFQVLCAIDLINNSKSDALLMSTESDFKNPFRLQIFLSIESKNAVTLDRKASQYLVRFLFFLLFIPLLSKYCLFIKVSPFSHTTFTAP